MLALYTSSHITIVHTINFNAGTISGGGGSGGDGDGWCCSCLFVVVAAINCTEQAGLTATHSSAPTSNCQRTEAGCGGGSGRCLTLFPTGTPSFCHSTVGSGVPEMPSWMSRGSPARTRISLAPNRLSRFSLGLSAKSRSISFTTSLLPCSSTHKASHPQTHQPTYEPCESFTHRAVHLPATSLLYPQTLQPLTNLSSHPQTYPAIRKLIDSVSHTKPFTCLLPHFSTHKPCSHPLTHPPTYTQAYWFIHLPTTSFLYPQTLQPPTDPSTHLHTSLLIHSPAYYLIPLPTSPAATHKPIHPPTSPAATHKPIHPPTSPAATHKPIHPPTKPSTHPQDQQLPTNPPVQKPPDSFTHRATPPQPHTSYAAADPPFMGLAGMGLVGMEGSEGPASLLAMTRYSYSLFSFTFSSL